MLNAPTGWWVKVGIVNLLTVTNKLKNQCPINQQGGG
jgi:hypothetical protein